MNNKEPITEELLRKYREGKATASERALLEQWYLSLEYDTTAFTGDEELNAWKEASWQAVAASRKQAAVPLYRRFGVVAAAAVLVLAVAGFWLLKNSIGINKAGKELAEKIVPASNKAVLVLSDGTTIELDSVLQNAITDPNGVTVINSAGSRLSYHDQAPADAAAPIAYNTLKTPRGGQYRLTLPDGTQVWMNSASELRYPTSFREANRVVELSGEAYFEVAQNARQPFKVKANGTEVKVLGTHFNVHAYPDEPNTQTTLVEGSIQVSNPTSDISKSANPNQRSAISKSAILVPGQQAVTTREDLTTRNANIKQVLSWKNGLFIFEEMKLEEVLREISRWYDIEVEYRAPVSEEHYGGVINRHSPLPKVLELLQENGIQHFKIEGRKILVLP